MEKESTKENTTEKLENIRYIVTNNKYGNFSISEEARSRYLEYLMKKKNIKEETTEKLEKRYIVINNNYGSFSLSEEAKSCYIETAGIKEEEWYEINIQRDDPYLVQIVTELGERANGPNSVLKVIEIPGDVEWELKEYCGREWVEEKHRIWC